MDMSLKPQPITETLSRVRPADDRADDGDRADLASDAFRIGIDTEGCDHIFSRIRATVTVLDDDEAVRTHSLADCRLSDWLTYISETRGWDSTRVGDW
jgi:hypothetical protein